MDLPNKTVTSNDQTINDSINISQLDFSKLYNSM